MLHAPVSHMSLLKDPDLHWIRRLAVTPRRGSIVSSRSAWRRAGAPSDGHTQWAAAFISTPQKQTYQESLFMTQWSFCRALFCFVSFFGGGVTHHSYHNRTSGEPNGAHVRSPDLRLKCRVCLSLQSGKCDHMAVSSRPPRVDAAVLSDCRRESEPFQFFVFFPVATEKQNKKKTLNSRHIVSWSQRLTLPSWMFRRHLADWHRRSRAAAGLRHTGKGGEIQQ